MAKRKPLTMDRVGEEMKTINGMWTELNIRLHETALVIASERLKQLHAEFDALRNRFAQLVQLAQSDSWPFFAEANGVELPEDDE